MVESERLFDANGVTLLGGADWSHADLDHALDHAPCLVAADGGANAAVAAGRIPRRVIGDMDSIDSATRLQLGQDRLWHVAEQDSTDFAKCLQRIDAPLILGLGFLGGRLDHTLAAFSDLVREPRPCILIGARDVVFAAPRCLSLPVKEGTRVSLFPMAPVTGRSRGLEWPIDGIAFAPNGRGGTSNCAKEKVDLHFDEAGMLVLLPRDCLDIAIGAFVP